MIFKAKLRPLQPGLNDMKIQIIPCLKRVYYGMEEIDGEDPSFKQNSPKTRKGKSRIEPGDIDRIVDFLRFLTLAAIERYIGKQ